jgi:hypothetical protein
MLIRFLDKAQREKELTAAFLEQKTKGKEGIITEEDIKKIEPEARKSANSLFMLRTTGAITQLFVNETILKDIDVYDTAGVRVGGEQADVVSPSLMVHSQIQAFKNRWGFERLAASVDIIIFILVLEEQQVDTEFQALFDAAREHGNLQNRLFIFLNKIDKAATQAINNKQYFEKDGEVYPDEDNTWKFWLQLNVMNRIRGLGDDFRNVFICHAPKFKIDEKKAMQFIKNSKQCPVLQRYLYNADKNMDAVLDDNDGGIRFGWLIVEEIMRTKGSQIRYTRLGQQILPYAKDLLAVYGAKRVTDEKPTDKEIDTYLERLLLDLKDLKWRTEEFHLPERFGEVCIQKGFVTSKQVEQALAEQEKIEKETGQRVRLGEIMKNKKFMTLDQVREALQGTGTDTMEWNAYQKATLEHVRTRIMSQIVSFMEDKGRPIIKGNIPVESVIQYLIDPLDILEKELKGLYTDKERKSFQTAVQNVLECQLTALLWNQEKLRKYLWDQKQRITSSFHIRDDISQEEAMVVTECYKKIKDLFDQLPALDNIV